MKQIKNGYIYVNNMLVIGWYDLDKKRSYRQGKRVCENDCPFTKTERRAYVKRGMVGLVKTLMAERGFGVSAAHAFAKAHLENK